MRPCCCKDIKCEITSGLTVELGYIDDDAQLEWVSLNTLRQKFVEDPFEANEIFWETDLPVDAIRLRFTKGDPLAYAASLVWACGQQGNKPVTKKDIESHFRIGGNIEVNDENPSGDPLGPPLDYSIYYGIQDDIWYNYLMLFDDDNYRLHNPVVTTIAPNSGDNIVVPDFTFELAQDVMNLYFGGTAGWPNREYSFKTKPDFDKFLSEEDMRSFTVDITMDALYKRVFGENDEDITDYFKQVDVRFKDDNDEDPPHKISVFGNKFGFSGNYRDHRYALGGMVVGWGISDDDADKLEKVLEDTEDLPEGVPEGTKPSSVTKNIIQEQTKSGATVTEGEFIGPFSTLAPQVSASIASTKFLNTIQFDIAVQKKPVRAIQHHSLLYKKRYVGGGSMINNHPDPFYNGDPHIRTHRLYEDAEVRDAGFVHPHDVPSFIESPLSVNGGAPRERNGLYGAVFASIGRVVVFYKNPKHTEDPNKLGNWTNGYDITLNITKIYQYKDEDENDVTKTVEYSQNIGRQAYVHAHCDPVIARCVHPSLMGYRLNDTKETHICQPLDGVATVSRQPIISGKSSSSPYTFCDTPETPLDSKHHCVGGVDNGSPWASTATLDSEGYPIENGQKLKCYESYEDYKKEYTDKHTVELLEGYRKYASQTHSDVPHVRCLDKRGHTLYTIRGTLNYSLYSWPQYTKVYTDANQNSTAKVNCFSPSIRAIANNKRRVVGLDCNLSGDCADLPVSEVTGFDWSPKHTITFECVKGTADVGSGGEFNPDCDWEYSSGDTSKYQGLYAFTGQLFYIYPEKRYDKFEIQNYVSQFPATFYEGFAHEAATAEDADDLFGITSNYDWRMCDDSLEPNRLQNRGTITDIYTTKIEAAETQFEFYTTSRTSINSFDYEDKAIISPFLAEDDPCKVVSIEGTDEGIIQDNLCAEKTVLAQGIWYKEFMNVKGRRAPDQPSVQLFPFCGSLSSKEGIKNGEEYDTPSDVWYFSTDSILVTDLLLDLGNDSAYYNEDHSRVKFDLTWRKDLRISDVDRLNVATINQDYSAGELDVQSDTFDYYKKNSSQFTTGTGANKRSSCVSSMHYAERDPDWLQTVSGHKLKIYPPGITRPSNQQDPRSYSSGDWWNKHKTVMSKYKYHEDEFFKVIIDPNTGQPKDPSVCAGENGGSDCLYWPSLEIASQKCLREVDFSKYIPNVGMQPPSVIEAPNHRLYSSTCPVEGVGSVFDCCGDTDDCCTLNQFGLYEPNPSLKNNARNLTVNFIDPYLTFGQNKTYVTNVNGVDANVTTNCGCSNYWEFAATLPLKGETSDECRVHSSGSAVLPLSPLNGGLPGPPATPYFYLSEPIAVASTTWKTSNDTQIMRTNTEQMVTDTHFYGDMKICTDIKLCTIAGFGMQQSGWCTLDGATCTECGGGNNEHTIPVIKGGTLTQQIHKCLGKCPRDGDPTVKDGLCGVLRFLTNECVGCGEGAYRTLEAQLKGVCQYIESPLKTLDSPYTGQNIENHKADASDYKDIEITHDIQTFQLRTPGFNWQTEDILPTKIEAHEMVCYKFVGDTPTYNNPDDAAKNEINYISPDYPHLNFIRGTDFNACFGGKCI